MCGGDGNDLRVRAQAGQPERGTLRFWLFLRAMCKRRMSRPDRNRCRSPKAEQDNGNTVLSLKPTDATKRSQTEWSGTDCTEQATCSGEKQQSVIGQKTLRFRPFLHLTGLEGGLFQGSYLT